MILELERAVAAFVESGISGVRCFGSESANTDGVYPCIYLTEIEERMRPLGCGSPDYVEREAGVAVRRGRILEHQTTLRFLVEADGSDSMTPMEQAHDVERKLNDLFTNAIYGRERLELTDPVSGRKVEVVAISFVGASDVPPVEDEEPYRFRRSVSYRFTYRQVFEEEVRHVIRNVHLTQGGEDV